MDKDEQAPSAAPKAPEPAAAPKAEPAPVEAPKAEPVPAEAPKAPEPAAPKVVAEAPKETATPAAPAEAPKKEPEAPKAEPASAPVAEEPKAEPTSTNDIAAEMDRLLKESSAEDKHKPEPQLVFGKKHNHVGIIFFLSLLVLAAVGFAIFEYMTAQNVKCECQKCEQTECDCKEEGISKDYLYISEWGIKIKIPKGLDHVGYSFGSATNDVLYINGIKSGLSETEKNSVDAVGTFFKGGIMLARQTVEENSNCSSDDGAELTMSCALAQYPAAYSTDKYVYVYNENFEGPLWTDGTDESLTSIEQSTTQLIIDMLSNEENYSEF